VCDESNLRLSKAVLEDPQLSAEFLDKYGKQIAAGDGGLESAPDVAEALATAMDAHGGLEAIVERFGRPALLVIGDSFEEPESAEWKARLDPHRAALAGAIRGVGRVDIRFHALPFGGTGWMVGEDIAVTNRHVAKLFALRRNGVFPIAANSRGQVYEPRIDFAEEHGSPESKEVKVTDVLFIAEDDDESADVAFLKLETGDGTPLPPPIPLGRLREPEPGGIVAAIGYPARDTRQDRADQDRIFGGIFNVKRLAPGLVKGGGGSVLTHDCSTLGGNSGSVVFDLETGDAVGLHFSGRRGVANYAVTASVVGDYLDRFVLGVGRRSRRGRGAKPVRQEPVSEEAPTTAEELQSRPGYDKAFLGGPVDVPMPVPRDDVVLEVDDETTPNELRYEHYSAVMHRERKMALMTAVNIDGSAIVRIKRGVDRWFFDPRIPKESQLGNELYSRNALDRGHLVRRLDPAWGDSKEAKRGEEDTFYFTNSAPQHSGLNRKTWASLEDYVLDNADTHGFKACVFTGPVFDEDDPPYRDLTRLPQAFWKLVVMLKQGEEEAAPELSATGYVLSQADLITDLEFAFGPFRTFQVPLSTLARLARLRLDEAVAQADPLLGLEAPPSFIEIEGAADLVV
jgi:endonuclease G